MKQEKLIWHTFGGGTGAAPGKNSYQTSQTDFGQYQIDPVSWPNGRHRYFVTYFLNIKGARPGGLWQEIAKGNVPTGKRIAREHFERISRGLQPVSEMHAEMNVSKNPVDKETMDAKRGKSHGSHDWYVAQLFKAAKVKDTGLKKSLDYDLQRMSKFHREGIKNDFRKVWKDYYDSQAAMRRATTKNPALPRLPNPAKKFTAKQIEALRKGFAGIQSVDPANPTYTKLTFMLDSYSQAMLKQLAGAKIKFLSGLARNRIKRKENPGMKKKRSVKQLANDKRLGRMAKARAKKRGSRRKIMQINPRQLSNPGNDPTLFKRASDFIQKLRWSNKAEAKAALKMLVNYSKDFGNSAEERKLYRQAASIIRAWIKDFATDQRGRARNPHSKTLDWAIGERVQLPAWSDFWMRGDRYGQVIGRGRAISGVKPLRVKLDKSKKVIRVFDKDVEFMGKA